MTYSKKSLYQRRYFIMAYRAILHFPNDQKECEKNYKEIANCRLRFVKAYIDSLNLTSKQAEDIKEQIHTISNSKKIENDIVMKKAS